MVIHQNEVVIFKGTLYYCSSRECLGHENQMSYAHKKIKAKSPQVPKSMYRKSHQLQGWTKIKLWSAYSCLYSLGFFWSGTHLRCLNVWGTVVKSWFMHENWEQVGENLSFDEAVRNSRCSATKNEIFRELRVMGLSLEQSMVWSYKLCFLRPKRHNWSRISL